MLQTEITRAREELQRQRQEADDMSDMVLVLQASIQARQREVQPPPPHHHTLITNSPLTRH